MRLPGVSEPQATFSACFGAPFMARHPSVYADLLGKKIVEHRVTCWLINTGWTAGPFGTGHRIPIAHTRAMVNAALDGKLAGVKDVEDPVFGLRVPTLCPNVPPDILIPRNTWPDGSAYDRQASKLSAMFVDNFKQFEDNASPSIRNAGPKA